MISLQEENTGQTTTARQRLAQSSGEETNTYASVKLPFIAPNLQTLVLSTSDEVSFILPYKFIVLEAKRMVA